MSGDSTTETRRAPLKPGDRAPDFALPAADREGTVSLVDYRGRTPLLLGLFRGTYCPFCRRAIIWTCPGFVDGVRLSHYATIASTLPAAHVSARSMESRPGVDNAASEYLNFAQCGY